MVPLMVSRPAQYQVLITDRDLNVVGDPVQWASLDITLRFNEPASGSFTAPASAGLLAQVAGDEISSARRVMVIRDGAVLVAGPVEQSGPQKWAVDGQDADPGTITVAFTDDLALVASRITYPTPSAAATAQTIDARWTATGNAEDIMRSLVNLNAGPGALTARRIPKLILGADQGVGSTIKFGTRFEPLCDALRSAAIAGGGLGFRTQQVGTNVEFQVYAPTDRTTGAGAVRFSRGLGNLRSYEYEQATPTATTVVVGGKDEGTSRVVIERTDTTAVSRWWRLETFVDQRQSDDTVIDPDELNQAGDEELTRSAAAARLSAVTVDTGDQRYGTHYQLGDRVAVELATGVQVTDVVRAAQITVTPTDGEQISALVGSQESSTDPLWVTHIRDLARRLGRLETI